MQLFKQRKSDRGDSFPRKAFTLPELLVVLVIMGLLAVMLLPARADSRTKSKSIRCVDNLRQVMNAVMMYTHDNHDLLLPNEDSGNSPLGHVWVQGSVGFPIGAAQFNPDILMDPQQCLITSYLNTNISLFRCTADARVGTYQGTNSAMVGAEVPVARSISMNQAVGTICPGFDSSGGGGHSGKPILSVNGPWLDNNHSHRRNSPYRTYGKVSDVITPGPARLWVMLEEDPYSINDGAFAFGMNIPEWIGFPSTLHGMSGVIGFADSHVEIHKWTDQRTRLIGGGLVTRTAVPGSADWAWLNERTSTR
jgi:prepilin-type N-terminal cleavage/methylation domain-containing protein